MWGAISDERTGLAFTIAAGPRKRSHSRLSDPLDSGPYFTVSDSRLPHESESYVTTDGQPASLSWSKAPTWGLRPDHYYLCDSYGLVLMVGPL
jgi:hypothetical protein